MTTLLIDALIVVWLLFFGSMAILPLITGGARAQQHADRPAEDRVISISPARPATRPQHSRTPLVPRTGHHDRPAA